MKYCLRTVSWRFHESSKLIPELAAKSKVYIRSPHDVYHSYRSLFVDQVRERFVVFWLSSSNKVQGFEIVAEGLLNSCPIHPREVFRGAIVATCASVILAHNHPSGNPEPSQEDLAMTKQLVKAGRIVGIPVLDHVIIAGENYVSLAQKGVL